MAIENTVPVVRGTLQLVQETNNLKRSINIILGFSLYCCFIPCTLVNKQTEGIILSNNAPWTVASDKWKNMAWSPVLNLKPSAERFGQRVKVKMVIQSIIKTLLKSKIINSFKLIYNHCLVSRISSLSIFLLKKPENLSLVRLAKSLVLKERFRFYQGIR